MGGPTTAVVVGVGPGLGASIARRFSKGGFPVALVSRSAENSRSLVEDITKAGGKAAAYSANAADTDKVGHSRACGMRCLISTFAHSPSVGSALPEIFFCTAKWCIASSDHA